MHYKGKFQSGNGNRESGNTKPRGRVKKAVILAAAVIAAVTLLLCLGYSRLMNKMNIVTLDPELYEQLYETTQESTAAPEETVETTQSVVTESLDGPVSPEDIINILVVGQAYRAGEATHMADTTLLVTLNTRTGTVTLSSVLRDALVSLPAYKSHTEGRNKFNVCYNLGYSWEGIEGAMAYTNATMYRNFGVEVDYNVEVSFESFIRLVDFLGGVELELTQAEADYLNQDDLYVTYEVKPGLQYLDGMAALSYARMRKAAGDGESDIKRTSRQRLLVEALAEKFRGLELSKLQSMANNLLPLITTTMTPKDVADVLLKMLPHISNLKFEGGTIPVETTYRGDMVDIYGDGVLHSVLRFDASQNKQLIRAFTEGETS